MIVALKTAWMVSNSKPLTTVSTNGKIIRPTGSMMLATKDLAFESDLFGGGHGAFTYFVVDGWNGAAATEGAKAVMNDPAVVAIAEKALKAAFGDKFRTSPPVTASEDFSEFADSGVPSMFFHIGVYEPERVAATLNGTAPPLPPNHSPLFAPVPKPTIQTGVEAMTLAVLSAFDQRAPGQ